MTDMMRMRYDANKRSTGLAYVLWFFLGWFGIHRFYLNRIPSGIVMLVIGVVSVPLTAILIGYIGLAIIGLWWCIDVFPHSRHDRGLQ